MRVCFERRKTKAGKMLEKKYTEETHALARTRSIYNSIFLGATLDEYSPQCAGKITSAHSHMM
jgi:hypothetical protein